MSDQYSIDWWFQHVFLKILIPILIMGILTWMTNINLRLRALELAIARGNEVDINLTSTLNRIDIKIGNIESYLLNQKQ